MKCGSSHFSRHSQAILGKQNANKFQDILQEQLSNGSSLLRPLSICQRIINISNKSTKYRLSFGQ